LSEQLASGAFVRGLWYFFGIVIAAGIFAGIAGLGVGYVAGMLWEQIHRHRRAQKLGQKEPGDLHEAPTLRAPSPIVQPLPRLQLVSAESPDIPVMDGRVLHSVQFRASTISLDLGGIRLTISGNPVTIYRGTRFRFPEPGARDALCSLIGDRIHQVRTPGIDRIELIFDSGCELLIPRNAIAVA
jgi:hypothetical protein